MSQPIGVCIVLVNTHNRVLLGRRKNSYKAGFMGCPGGRIEFGERVIDCAQRELKEETGIEIKDIEYLGVVKETQEEQDFVHFVCLVKLQLEEPKVMEPDKCEEWKWFDPHQLPPKTLPGHLAAIHLWKKKLHFYEMDESEIPEFLTIS